MQVFVRGACTVCLSVCAVLNVADTFCNKNREWKPLTLKHTHFEKGQKIYPSCDPPLNNRINSGLTSACLYSVRIMLVACFLSVHLNVFPLMTTMMMKNCMSNALPMFPGCLARLFFPRVSVRVFRQYFVFSDTFPPSIYKPLLLKMKKKTKQNRRRKTLLHDVINCLQALFRLKKTTTKKTFHLK